ncbi:MAG: ADP-glyceromanno-heptose 6-epimerase [Elusimicrobia bacterium]|nr:MAG: ADP-glyceromanno-heptose 6-epimerase [Elusimicrobiota bacterium]
MKQKLDRVLVTGGAGFIGSNLAMELRSKGVGVIIVDDFSTGHFENLVDFDGDVIAADLFDADAWKGKVGAVDAVFHQAAITDTTVTDQKRMMEVNVEAFRNVLNFAVESGIKRVVYASSAGTYGAGKTPMKETDDTEPMNVYGFSKKVMEATAREFHHEEPGLALVGLRYFNVYGPRESFKGHASSMIMQLYDQMKAGKRPRVFKYGEQFRDFIYVKDVVSANLAAVEADSSGVYNVCTGKTTDFNAVISELNKVLGTSFEPDYFDNPYSFYQNETQGDPTAATKALGFTAKFSSADGIRDYFGATPEPVGAQ